MTPLSLLIAASYQQLQISFTISSPLQPLGTILIYFPLWNPSDGPTAQHHIQQATPYCSPNQGLNPSMSCAYQKLTQTLTIITPVATLTPAGTQLVFTMDNFLNPYNGKPKHGFTITTTDQMGGLVDSSTASNLDISVTVSQWATIGSAKMSRFDVMTTVRMVSAGQLTIASNIPIDAECRIQVVFPPDMPLTADLTKVASQGIINTGQVSPNGINLATSSFYLDGCTQYYSSVSNALQMFKMMNKDCVRQTFSF